MSSPKTETKSSPPRSYGWVAEYADEHQLLDACRKVRDSGYTRTDAFAPFPVHGIDEALGIRPTVLPWIVLCLGLTGLSAALLMQWWMNAYDYPYIISGKPYFSLPAFIPIMFESTVLFSAFTTFIAMVLLNGLPRFNHPLFTNPKFDRSTDDRFFLWVDARDKYFNSDKVKTLLESTSPMGVDVVREDDSSDVVPGAVWRGLAALIVLTLIPAGLVLRMRASRSEEPRLHVFFDMDFQPKKRAQQTSSLFADNRASRPPVAGTIARGDLTESDPYYLGYTPQDVALNRAPSAARMVALQDAAASGEVKTLALPEEGGQPPAPSAAQQNPAAQPADRATADTPADAKPTQATEELAKPQDNNAQENQSQENQSQEKQSQENKPAESAAAKPAEPPAASPQAAEKAPVSGAAQDAAAAPAGAAASGAAAAAEPELPWITEFPFQAADQKMMALGKLKYETNCAVCHGFAGDGDGLVSLRALQLAQGYWVQPTSLHEPRVQRQPVGKIFHTITNGRGKMGAYGPVLTAKERWAIVLYVRALQRSRDAKLEDVPEAQRAKLTATQGK